MIKLAVRVVKALPPVLNNAGVPAFECAAKIDGATKPSNPPLPPPVITELPFAPAHQKHSENISFAVGDGNRHFFIHRNGGRNALRDDRPHLGGGQSRLCKDSTGAED